MKNFILRSYFYIKHFGQSEAKAFGLDTSETRIEKNSNDKVNPVTHIHLTSVDYNKYPHKSHPNLG